MEFVDEKDFAFSIRNTRQQQRCEMFCVLLHWYSWVECMWLTIEPFLLSTKMLTVMHEVHGVHNVQFASAYNKKKTGNMARISNKILLFVSTLYAFLI